MAWIDKTPELIERVERFRIVDDTDVFPAPAQHAPRVGDKREFYAIDFSRQNKAYFVSATCRAVGEYCYIFVEDTQWQKGKVKSDDVSKIRTAFDNSTPADNARGIYEIESHELGIPPDEIDQDPNVYILILDIPDSNVDGSFVAGYFEPLNQKRGVLRDPIGGMLFRSNEVEMIYLDCDPMSIGNAMAREVLAHEFQHLIHWGKDPDEDAWINEGCSEYASLFLCGYGNGDSAHIKAFENNPQTSLAYWDGSLAGYGAVYLWMVYLHENYGGSSTISNLIANQADGIHGVNSTLISKGYSENFNDVFSNWKLANYLDDTQFGSGKYGYQGLDIRLNDDIRHSRLPISGKSISIGSYSCSYVEFSGSNGGLGIKIGVKARRPSEKLDARIISILDGKLIGIDTIPIESGEGSIMLSAFGHNFDRAILATSWLPNSKADYGDITSYEYSANPGGEIAFAVKVLPNAVNKRYFSFIAKLLEKGQSPVMVIELPKITIKKAGKTIFGGQDMSPLDTDREGKTYIYQFYIPLEWNAREIMWEISCFGHLVASGSMDGSWD